MESYFFHKIIPSYKVYTRIVYGRMVYKSNRIVRESNQIVRFDSNSDSRTTRLLLDYSIRLRYLLLLEFIRSYSNNSILFELFVLIPNIRLLTT